MKNWIVVANSARARVLEEPDEMPERGRSRRTAFVHVADLVHPASRQKGVQLGDDRPGHVEGTGHGLGSTSYVPRTDPREREHDRFAREVARVIDHGVAEGRCAGLLLVATSPFLGRLKQHLGQQARKAILRTVTADYTTLDEAALGDRLASTVPAR